MSDNEIDFEKFVESNIHILLKYKNENEASIRGLFYALAISTIFSHIAHSIENCENGHKEFVINLKKASDLIAGFFSESGDRNKTNDFILTITEVLKKEISSRDRNDP